MGSTAKRRRKNGADNVVADTHNATPLITRLPFELIAEILLYSKSPAELLSLSRTCKHFHATLVQNPAAVFIWKDVRAQTTPPIPSPIKFGFSEPQLANFIYGGGKCTECGKRTSNMYTSFSAQIRLCGNSKCRSGYLDNRVLSYAIPPHATWLPWIEWSDTTQVPSEHPYVIVNHIVLVDEGHVDLTYVPGQLLQANNEYNKANLLPTTLDEYKQKKQKYVDGLEDWMNGCLELCRWKWEFTRLQKLTTTTNYKQVEQFAIERVLSKDLVLNTPTVVSLLREKLLDFRSVTPSDLETLLPEIEADLTRIENRRKNAKIESSRLRRHREVARLYRDLDHAEFDCFPSLPQFRKLPTLRAFQYSTVDLESTPWRNDFVDTLVKRDVQEWAKKMIQEFSERLGYPEWPLTGALAHPVNRISSRYICTRCSESGPKAARNKSLNFREVASHICSVSEKWNKDQWSPKNFVVDIKATAVITRFVTAVGMDMDEKTTTDSKTLSLNIMCLSCSAPIVMNFDTMIQHSHRHDDMQFMVLADEELTKFSDYPVTPGITAQFTKTDQKTMEQRRNPYFSCKHCIPNPLASRETEPSSDRKAPLSKKKSKTFSFDGLRDHLKQKHKVAEVADEDFFVVGEYLQELGYNDSE